MTLTKRVLLVACSLAYSLHGQSNETAVENANPGTTNWQLGNPALNREIEGYASLTSVNVGSSISFFVSTAAPSYTMDVYRLGWYGGAGGRQMVSTIPRTGVLQTTPTADSFGRFECNWTSPYVLSIPANWVSGIYLVKLTASTGPQSYIQFVVREDSRASAFLFQHSDTTDQAYNNWPGPAAHGNSLYTFNSNNSVAAVKVSFNRPYFIDTDSHNFSQVGAGFLLRWEVMMLRWLESKGYDVAYCSTLDNHENANLLLSHKAFLSVGHDEYWSWEMRANVEAARDKGVNLGFFSADVCYWQIRLETSPISGATDRTIVAYKETAEAGLYGETVTNDPTTNQCLITTNWRFNSCKPSEQAFVGVEFIEGSVGCPSSSTCVDMVIADGTSWTLAGSGLTTGSHIPGILGYEVDGELISDSPSGTAIIAKSPIPILDADAQTHPFSEMVTYTAASGATVFAVGTFQWTWGLDDWGAPTQRPSQLSPAVQTITQNVLSRFAPAATSAPDLTITKSHTGNFAPGQTGATYTITVTNSGNATTSGTVTVTDTVPTGLTATAISGSGWTCTQPAGSCTRSDALAAAASYPALTLTVNVASNAPATVTNTASVAGGGETNTSNDTASDLTAIGSSGPPVTDNFNTTSLNTSLWTFVNPVGDGSFSLTGSQLKLNVPAGSNHDPVFGGVDNSVRVVQTIGNVDFTVTTKFDSIPNQQYEFEGTVVNQDAANYLRFQFGSTSSALFATASVILSHNETGQFTNQITLPGGTTSLWLRVQKAGNTWTESWSPDGTTFTTAGTFTQALTVTDVGTFAANYNPTTSAAPAFSALIDSFVSATGAAVPDLTITKSHTGNFAQGQTGATYTITVTNSGGAATSGTVTVTDTLPTGLTATAIAGTGWTCTQPAGSCTRSDVLAAAASYPALTLTVNVAANAPATVTNTATVAGGGETNTSNDTASNPTTVGTAATPDLTITKSHTGNFAQSQTGATYTITVTNSGSAATSGTVTVTDTVPTGLTATAISGTGWTCTQPAGSCTRSDALAAAASYPALTLTVNVASNAPATVTNTATVAGGGETNTSNDTASDATTIGSSAGAPVTDNFNTTSLNTALWTFVNPVGDGSFSLTGTQLKLNVPAGPNHDAAFNGVDSAPRVVQTIANVDFTVTTKFDSIPSQQYQFEGMVVDQNASNFLRLQFGSSGSVLAISADAIVAGTINGLFSNTITLPGGTTSLWLRLQRTGNSWTATWSPDGTTFNTGGTFTQAFTIADIGLFAGNYSGTSAPAFSGLIDSFVSGTGAAAPDLTITKSHTGNFAQGQTGATYSITVTNSGGAATSGTVTVTDTVPTGLTATAISGTGWTCTQPAGSCTRSDVLAAAASYPALTLTVNVAANAAATVTNTATVAGGGETNTSNDTAADVTTVGTAATPDLTITKSHTGNFAQGQTGATYTITVTNSGAAATSGTVTVTDTVPTGLTATAISGTGWTCTQPAGSCTRSDALAAAASYPVLTLTVNVASSAPATVTNTATVAGGGETNTSNDSALDATTIGSSAGAPVTDNFNTTSLNTALWTFVNPVGDGSFSMTGTQLKLNVPAGPNHDAAFNGVDSAPRVVQTIANVDFTVTTKFDSIPSQQYQFEGMVVDQNASNFLRLQFGSSGSVFGISADAVVAGTINGLFSNTITLPGGTTSLWLRLQRTGNSWTATWSPDGTTFNAAGTFTQALTAADIALFAGNYSGTSAPSFSALIDSFVSGTVAAVPDLTITKSHTGNFAQGQTGATYSITVTNSGGAATSGTVTVTDTLPTGLTATAISGTGWTCTQPAGSCTRSDALAAAASYPALTLTVNVAANAPATVTNTATVAGGGETNTSNDTASNATTIGTAATPDLTITKSHTGNFAQGQTGATYTITVTNSGAAATSGTVTVTDTVPTSLTATAISGPGWTCTQPAGSCTRSDALAAAASYPALTLTANVASNAPATVTNTATVAGGGETNTSNDTASDATTIGSSAGAPVTDNFNTTSLNTALWTLLNPVGDGSFSMTGSQLKLNVPAGSDHDPVFGGADNSVRVVQTISNADFTVTTKFDSIPNQQYEFEGTVVNQDAANYLRFQFGSSSSALFATASVILSHNETSQFTNQITLPGGTTSLWLRVQKAGNTWTESWSPDGTTFTTAGTFTQALTVTDVGAFVANYNPTTSSAPAFSALIDSFVSGTVAAVPDLTITKSHTGNFAQGQTGATYTITVTNSGGAATSGTVTVTDTLPTGLTATAISGTGWTCTQPAGSCTRSDVLAAAASYPALTLTVNVAANAPATVTNTATVAGGGETNTSNDTALNPTTVGTAATPDLTITKSHSGSFAQGQTGATYTITVTNSGSAATSGTVTVTDTVPAGLTASAISGTGWTCTQPAGSCTRSDALAAAASYPALTLTVNVASNAPASVTNTATVAGGGETNMSNDSASDVTAIQSAGGLVSDDFTSGTLNTGVWTFVNPQNDGSFSLNGNSLVLNVPAGINHDEWTNGANGIGVMQAAPNTDFEIEVKFSSALNKQTPFQQQGIIIQQDAANFLRLCMYSDNQRTLVFLASILGTTGNVIVSQETRGGAATWMRVKRTGNNWLFSYSYDSIHWTPFAFTQALNVTKVGPYAGNSQFNGGPAPAYTAIVDHFVNRAVPPSTIDGSTYPPPAAPPVINVWYGDSQTFGQPGIPQQWVNILGDVSDFDQVTTLTYSVNGGAAQPLSMGENVVRLVAPGDFNVEIDYASLNVGSNVVTITATDTLGRQTQHNVTLTVIKNQTWPSNYTADWSTVQSPQSIAQVVDGPWRIQSGAVRITETGYDRLIAIGDRTTWKNFVATAEVTLNSLDTYGYAVAIIAGWQGHTTLQYGQPLPDQPRTGHPFPAFGGYAMGLPGPPSLMIYQNTPSVPESVIVQDSTVTLQIGVKYIFKLQAQQNTSGGSHYMFKVWLASSVEPANWNLQGDGDLSNGSIVLAAHRADVSWGLVTVTGL